MQLPDELIDLQSAIRRFVKVEVTEDLITKCEASRRPPLELLQAVADSGWLAVGVPEEFGGYQTFLGVAVLLEELAYAYHPLADVVYRALLHGASTLISHGAPELQAEFLPQILEGKLLFLNAITEPDTGADAASIRTRAVLQGDEFVINGHKIFNTGMEYSDFAVCYANTDPEAGRHLGISAILVPTRAQGVTFKRLETVGFRATPTYEVWYDDVRVPAKNLLGELNAGWKIMMSHLDRERMAACAMCTGGAQELLDETVRYAQVREQFGRPIGKYQAVSHMIADMQVNTMLSRLMTYELAQQLDDGKSARLEAAVAKLFVTEAYKNASDTAMQVWGAYGYVESSVVNRHWRDSRLMTIGGGSSQIQRNIIGRLLGL